MDRLCDCLGANPMIIPESEQNEVLHCAFRYALGRATYVSGFVAQLIIAAWPKIPSQWRSLYQSEIRKALESNRAGHEIDRRDWAKILELEP